VFKRHKSSSSKGDEPPFVLLRAVGGLSSLWSIKSREDPSFDYQAIEGSLLVGVV
jgi:hypothetical protein